MIIENLEVIFTSKNYQFNKTPDERFYNPSIRSAMTQILYNLVEYRKLPVEMLYSKINESDAAISSAVDILQGFGIISIHRDHIVNVISISIDTWEAEFSRAFDKLNKRFTDNLKHIRGKIVYRCSENCSNTIYNSEWARDNKMKCINGHRLELIPHQEKRLIVKQIQDDIRTLTSVKSPSDIIDDINNKAAVIPSELKKEEKVTPMFHTNMFFFSVMSHFIRMNSYFPLSVI